MKIMRIIFLVLVFVIFVGCLQQTTEVASTPAITQKPVPTPTPNWEYGKVILNQKSCTVCHVSGTEEKSTGMRLEELQAKMAENYSFADFKKAVERQGKLMPSYKGLLSKNELCCLYSFLTKGKTVEGCAPCKKVILD
jgi:cytochrome c551/c552